MYIVLGLICENFNRIAVKISFISGLKYSVYAAVSFSENVTSWWLCNDKQNVISVILYMNIIFMAHWLFGGNSEILHFSDVFAHRQKTL